MAKYQKNLLEIPRKELGADDIQTNLTIIGFSIIGLFGLILFWLYTGEFDHASLFTRVFLWIVFFIGIYFGLFRKPLKQRQYERMPMMQFDGISYHGPFGIEEKHSYTEWAQSIKKGHYCIGRRGFVFWLGYERIVFLYNVGMTDARNKSQKRYEIFTDYILKADPTLQGKLPKFTKENIDLLDKKCFYHRSRMHQFGVALLNLFVFLCISMDGTWDSCMAAVVVCGVIESLMLYFLVKGAYYNYKNEKKLREKLPDETGLVRDKGIGFLKPYWGFVYTVLVFAFMYYWQYIFAWNL